MRYLICLLLAGCSSPLPYCAKFTAYAVESTEAGAGLFFDLDNVRLLTDTLNGLNENKCKLEKKGAT